MQSFKVLTQFLLVLFITSILSSCRNNVEYHNVARETRAEAEIIRANHITKVVITKSYLDANGLDTLKRVDRVKLFNEAGLCITEITPEYLEVYPRRKPGSIATLADLNSRHTSIYMHISDTAYMEYDLAYHLVRRVTSFRGDKIIDDWTYDERGNELSYCHNLKYTPMKCSYTSYIYKDGKVISRIDSSDETITSSTPTHFTYVYDAKGNVINDGRYRYEIDDQNRVLAFIPEVNGYLGERRKLDANGNTVERMTLYYNPVQKKVEEFSGIERFKYDSRHLLVEETHYSNGRVSEVFDYAYE